MSKIIIPIIIVIIVLLYSLFIAVPVLTQEVPIAMKVLVGGGELLLVGGLVKVLIERVQEIREEDKDDLSKY